MGMCGTQERINISKTKTENKCSSPAKITEFSLNIVFSIILCLCFYNPSQFFFRNGFKQAMTSSTAHPVQPSSSAGGADRSRRQR